MKLYIITSPGFTGHAELLYDVTGRLVRIDISKTNMDLNQVQKFKERVSALQGSLIESFNGTKVTIVEGEFEVSFDMFWIAYSKKINKQRCEALWSKMSLAKRVAAWQGIAAYDNFLKLTSWRKKCDPETYLKKESWENEWE